MTGDTAVVLMSGGIDSATCMAVACDMFARVVPVHFDYGQQTNALEQSMAHKQAQHLEEQYPSTEIEHLRVVNYSPVFKHFAQGVADSGKDFGDMVEDDGRSSGYVPMRNIHLISTAAAFADVEGAVAVYHGAQAGDEADYPDCRQEFMDSAAGAISKSLPDNRHIDLRTPLLHLEKFEVLHLADIHHVDLGLTYSCYSEVDDLDDPTPCGDCPACVERAESFEKAGLKDPHQTAEVTDV